MSEDNHGLILVTAYWTARLLWWLWDSAVALVRSLRAPTYGWVHMQECAGVWHQRTGETLSYPEALARGLMPLNTTRSRCPSCGADMHGTRCPFCEYDCKERA